METAGARHSPRRHTHPGKVPPRSHESRFAPPLSTKWPFSRIWPQFRLPQRPVSQQRQMRRWPRLPTVGHAVAVSDPQPAWQEWQEWLDSLDVARKAAAESLRAQFSSLGVTDPVDLIKSEVMEDLPQLARF